MGNRLSASARASWTAVALYRFSPRKEETLTRHSTVTTRFNPRTICHPPCKSARGLAQSKTWRKLETAPRIARASWTAVALYRFSPRKEETLTRHSTVTTKFNPLTICHLLCKSARGLAQSKTWRKHQRPRTSFQLVSSLCRRSP
jgi:hypothetical protein